MFAQVPTPVSLSLHSKRLCCSVLQCVAVCDIVLQCVASGTHTSLALLTLQESVLQCVAVCCSVLQCDCQVPTRILPLLHSEKTERQKFSEVSSLLNLLYTITVELTFEEFYQCSERKEGQAHYARAAARVQPPRY